MVCSRLSLMDSSKMHKLEFCLLSIGHILESQDTDLSKKLIELASNSHYYLPSNASKNAQENDVKDELYEELFTRFKNIQDARLKNDTH